MTSNANNLKLDFNKISSIHFFKSEEQSPLETPTDSDKDQQEEQLSPIKKKALMFYSRLGKSIDFANSPKDVKQTQKTQLLQKIDIVNTYKVKQLQNGIQKENKYEAVTGSNNQFKLNFGYNSVLPHKNQIENDSFTQSLQLDFRKPNLQQQIQQPAIHSNTNSASTLSSSIKLCNDQETSNKNQFQSCIRNGKKHSSLKFQHSITVNQQQIQQEKSEKDRINLENQQKLLVINTKKPNFNIDTDQQLNNGLSIFQNEFIQKVASLSSIQSPNASQRNSFSTLLSHNNQKSLLQHQEPFTFQDHLNQVQKKKYQQDKNNYSTSKNRLKQENINSEQTPNYQSQKNTADSKNQTLFFQKSHQQTQYKNNQNPDNSNIVNYFISQVQSSISVLHQNNKQLINDKQLYSSSNTEVDQKMFKQHSESEQIIKNSSQIQSASLLDKSDKTISSPKSAIDNPIRPNNMPYERRIKLFQLNNQFYPQKISKQGSSLSPSRQKTNVIQYKISDNLSPKNINKQTKNVLYSKLNSVNNKESQYYQSENEETIQQIYPESQQNIKSFSQFSQFENLSQKIKNSSLTTIQNIIKKEVNKMSDFTQFTIDNFTKNQQNISFLNQNELQNNQIYKNDSIYQNSNHFLQKQNNLTQKIVIVDQKEKDCSPNNANIMIQLAQINKKSSNNQIQLFEDIESSPSRKLNSIHQQNIEQRYRVRDQYQQRSLSQICPINSRLSFTNANASQSNTPQQKLAEGNTENTFSDFIFQNSSQKSSTLQLCNSSITPKNQDPEKNRKILKCLFLKNPQESPFKLIQKQRKIKSNNNQLQN
ncbi:hypothetical protein TTHERM_00148880 (macronuclear) [Tetrahymena thermophila SB210]|uniref:Uncharacterized protein n=1 Tax=Tetrahymena thermophila (strain SB210) TaxID=312017 RepID=I7M2T7_TETTS|nr:hypothetical protein TTHERM_00148880 [Tetrahymena thermophila SB210]EAS01278.1 hypothetical protein TTHERM_00148880 [Tetrahymena thermophila SB210]|eukprot:XP_001021523.1 hypothetical protein TTHERM_00148880 [Tetrahymena thermophila SB210]